MLEQRPLTPGVRWGGEVGMWYWGPAVPTWVAGGTHPAPTQSTQGEVVLEAAVSWRML